MSDNVLRAVENIEGGPGMHFITFSRKMGSMGSEIARQVADQLNYQFYDTEAIANKAREMGFGEDIKEIDEKGPSLLERLFSLKPTISLDRLTSVVYELASRGNAVFLGRGGHLLFSSLKCALHVRVIASLENRIQNLGQRGFNKGIAVDAVNKSDYERAAFIKFAFGKDWDNPELYDIVLNTDNVTVDLAVKTVLQMGLSEEMKACSVNAMRSLEMMGLSRRLQATLIEAGLIYSKSRSLSVSVLEPGKIRVTGMIASESDKARVEEILKAIPGVQSIEFQVQIIEG
jgi:cytidylate kinase/ribosomal 50S subunit-recycling heat shock protein